MEQQTKPNAFAIGEKADGKFIIVEVGQFIRWKENQTEDEQVSKIESIFQVDSNAPTLSARNCSTNKPSAVFINEIINHFFSLEDAQYNVTKLAKASYDSQEEAESSSEYKALLSQPVVLPKIEVELEIVTTNGSTPYPEDEVQSEASIFSDEDIYLNLTDDEFDDTSSLVEEAVDIELGYIKTDLIEAIEGNRINGCFASGLVGDNPADIYRARMHTLISKLLNPRGNTSRQIRRTISELAINCIACHMALKNNKAFSEV